MYVGQSDVTGTNKTKGEDKQKIIREYNKKVLSRHIVNKITVKVKLAILS